LWGAAALLAVLTTPGQAQAVSLDLCFFSESTGVTPCQEVFYSACGSSFHPLYKFLSNGDFEHATTFLGCGLSAPTSTATGFSLTTNGTVNTLSFQATTNCPTFETQLIARCVAASSCVKTSITDSGEQANLNPVAPGTCPTPGARVCWGAIVEATGSPLPPKPDGQFDVAFLSAPTPEPSTYVALAGGLGLLWATRKRRKAQS
jgi:hypothetical protein